MKGNLAQLQGGRELSYITQNDSYAGSLFSRIIDAINNMAKSTSVSATGKLPPPPPIDGVTVAGTVDDTGTVITTPSEHLHWTIEHNGAVQKGVQYMSEISTEPNFIRPHVVDHGCSRSGFLHLPALDETGAAQTYYLRSYAQYHGSDPTDPTVVGGKSQAVQINLTGASQMNLLNSKGSGTASPTGEQGGHGIGKVLDRPAPQAKRQLK
jgi:hypothetical protein